MDGSVSRWRDREDFEEALALTKVFIAMQLGPKPWRVADQRAAVLRAGDVLASLTTIEANKARRILAVEYLALAITRGRPELADWEAAVKKVAGSAPEEVALMARGGISLRASRGGWDRRPAPQQTSKS